MFWRHRWSLTLCTVFLAIGVALGWFWHNTSPTVYKGGILYQSSTKFQYIDPLVACDIGSQDAFPEFAPLKQTLTNLIQQKEQAGQLTEASVYLRSLQSARWFDINDTQTYAPASLLKVFVMLAYYKEADDSDNPGLLQQEIPFEGSANPSADMPGAVIPHLVSGQLYTVNQIINQMIIYSDNDALNTLVDHFDPQTLSAFEEIFTDLNVPSPVTESESTFNFMTVDNYAMVFRVLYSATYLSNRYSEMALNLLTQVQYKSGLVAGVPSNFAVAHKFGDATVPATTTSTAENELHDCGIVYYPNHPYLLCVMTEGQSFADLQETIADISSTTYQWLNQYFKTLPNAASSSPVITP